jgi:hypothetical protein
MSENRKRYRFTKDEINVSQSKYGGYLLSVILNGERVERHYIGYSKVEAIKKFQRDCGTYPNNFIPAGVLTLNNYGGIAIMEIEHGIEDYAVVCDNYGDGYNNLYKHLIKYDMKGDPYFVRNRKKYYINEFMRCDIGKAQPKIIYYTDKIYGGHFTYEEMVEDAKKNYDYGDETNYLTYVKDWWREYYKVVS